VSFWGGDTVAAPGWKGCFHAEGCGEEPAGYVIEDGGMWLPHCATAIADLLERGGYCRIGGPALVIQQAGGTGLSAT